MDYAFAPGRTRYDNIMHQLFQRRPNTTLINQRRVTRVDQFLDHLNTAASIGLPVGDFVISSHGNDAGYMQLQLADIHLAGRRRAETVTTFEVLEEAVNTGIISIPNSLTNPRPVAGVPAGFHIRGCKIGQAEPFVRKLKEALGGQVTVTAPMHFHQNRNLPRMGVLEHLGYDFAVKRNTAFANKAELVAAFQAANLTFFENTAVPNDSWNDWIPGNIRRARTAKRFTVNLGTPIQRNATHQITNVRVDGQYRHDQESFTYTIPYSSGAPGTTHAERLTVLTTSLNAHAAFSSGHEFPMYQRYETTSVSDFLDDFTWTFSWSRRTRILTCVGRRHRYTMIVPVTDPATNNLCLNFFPNAGNPTPVIRLLPENDSRFFLTV